MNLNGRYLKALVKNPQCISMNVGEYCLIYDDVKERITRVKDGNKGFMYSYHNIGVLWELMPENFDPNNINKELEIEIW